MRVVGLSISSYYYQEGKGKKGVPASTSTPHCTQGAVSNTQVIEQIKAILSEPFKDYWGYHNVAAELRDRGFSVNDKKVYRLMRESKLLRKDLRIKPDRTARKFVRHRKVKTTKPMECVEMDIKFVWIAEKGKNAYLLTLIDVHTRKVLAYYFGWHIKSDAVMQTCASLIDTNVLSKGVVIRSDNGSVFIAQQVRNYLSAMGVEQEFTHVATPEENAHVEAYHGILKRELFDRYEYRTYQEFEGMIENYVAYYNHQRRHGSINRMTPQQKWIAEFGKDKI